MLRIRPLFRLSFPYAPAESSPRLLALYALFSALEEALCRVSDETVARAKLGWWQQQLLGPDYRTSAHPITRQLYQNGVIATGAQEHVWGLLATTLNRLDMAPPADEQELQSLCRLIGEYPLHLELSIQGQHETEKVALSAACAVNGLVQLLRESSRSELPAYAWLPMNLLVQHGVTPHDIQSGSRPDRTRQLMRQLCMLGLSWIKDGVGDDEELRLRIGPAWRHRHRHWLIHTELNARRLKKLRDVGARRHGQVFAATGPGDVWLAWRSARRISRGGNHK